MKGYLSQFLSETPMRIYFVSDFFQGYVQAYSRDAEV
jgi:hypothetical protein